MAWAETWRIPFDTFPYRFNLECISDFQLGSRSCCEWKIKQHIDDILGNAKTTDSGILVAGDLEDEDRPSTRAIRAHIGAERAEVVQRDAMKHIAWLEQKVIPILLPLHKGTKYGIMGGVAGHHWTQLTEYEKDGKHEPAINSVQYIYRRLQELTGKPCLYLGEMVSFIDLTFTYRKVKGEADQGIRIVGLLQHGEGGGAINKLTRAAKGFEADFFIRGHDCKLIGTKEDQLYARETRSGGEPAILSRTRAMLNLGAATMGYEMTKGVPSYIEQKMMLPSTMGWGTLKFRIRRSLQVEDKNRNARFDIKVEL